ncbi:MAG: anhydro-N-acetylmuramic acid kinase [Rickettsiaceae bacterium]
MTKHSSFHRLSKALQQNIQRRKALTNNPSNTLVIGLMSGTSCDGIDISIIKTNGTDYIEIIANDFFIYPSQFQKKLKKLHKLSADKLLPIEKQFTIYNVYLIQSLLKRLEINADDISAIGFHGHTVYHDPTQSITMQIGNPHLLSALTKINVVYDFRRKDMAYNGQGAPLVPIFHKALFLQYTHNPIAVINIGGVANLTYINQESIIAFDTGPGCALIDDAMLKLYNQSYDIDGQTAKMGIVQKKLVRQFIANDFFNQAPPKSLNRNHFHDFAHCLLDEKIEKQNQIATLTEFTIASICKGLEQLPNYPKIIYLCGGGAKNSSIRNGIKVQIKKQQSKLVDDNKIDTDFIESQAFAYLAARYIKGLPSNFKTTTGANQELVLGVLVPVL